MAVIDSYTAFDVTLDAVSFFQIGSNGNDRIEGDGGRDSIFGRGGNDRLIAKGGNDHVRGGSGNDEISATVTFDSVIAVRANLEER
ncbi:MAG: hypothetical protein AAFX39_08160, partial [Pseudomonadota bacterium]